MKKTDQSSYIKKLENEIESLEKKMNKIKKEKEEIQKEFEQKNKERMKKAEKSVKDYKPSRIPLPKTRDLKKNEVSQDMIHNTIYELFKIHHTL